VRLYYYQLNFDPQNTLMPILSLNIMIRSMLRDLSMIKREVFQTNFSYRPVEYFIGKGGFFTVILIVKTKLK
jgi:hypothetical protein